MKIVFVFFIFIISLILFASSLRCFGGLNEYFSDESLLKIENTHYVCGNNSDWDEIIIEDGEWFCMVY
jgi:hypothetical protein